MFEQIQNYSVLFWFILGVVLFIVEMVVPGFVLMFFGIGAWITAILTWTGVISSFSMQVVVFLVSSLVTLFLFRSRLSNYFKGKASDSEDSLTSVVGQKAVVKKEIKPGEVSGKVEFNGTMWNAEADEFIPEGTVVGIVERKNLVLKVKKTE
jgi:membrane protein implicated in regulation of membrane protease activity